MHKFMFGLLLCAAAASASGCAVPIYSGDPQRRANQLINTSENLRLFLDDWERMWFLDMPVHATPTRTHGGLM